MTKRKSSRTRSGRSRSSTSTRKPRSRSARTVEDPEEDEELEEEAEVEEAEEDDEEEAKPARKPRSRRSSTRRRKEPEDVEEEEAEEEEDEEPEAEEDAKPARKPRSRSGARGRSRAKAKEEEAEEKPKRGRSRRAPDPEDVEELEGEPMAENELVGLLHGVLMRGDAIIFKRIGDDYILAKFDGTVTKSAGSAEGKKKGRRKRLMSWDDWNETVYTPEFLEHAEMWSALTFEEKVAEAEAEDIEWDRHPTPRVDNMRLTQAYREQMEITKFNEGYEDKKVRDALMWGES